MKELVLLSVGLLVLVGCDPPRRRSDAGPDARSTAVDVGPSPWGDAGPIAHLDAAYPVGIDANLPDAVVPPIDTNPPDAVVARTDAYVPRPDAATIDARPPVCGDYPGVSSTSVPAMPGACLPRCRSATLTAINACPADDDGTCLFAALDADTTPAASMTVAGGGAIDVTCGLCFDLQRFSCYSEPCPSSAASYLLCDSSTDPDGCAGERSALVSCLDGLSATQQTRLDTCFNTVVIACFDTAGGFAPSSPRLAVSPSLVDPISEAAPR